MGEGSAPRCRRAFSSRTFFVNTHSSLHRIQSGVASVLLHLQVGRHADVLEALRVALRTDGTRGLFRGTIPLLSREVPFYVVGMTGYAYLKNVFNGGSVPLGPCRCIPELRLRRTMQKRSLHAAPT